MNSEKLLLYLALGVGAYVLIKKFQESGYSEPIEKEQLASMISSAGGSVRNTSLGTFYDIPGGVIKLPEGKSQLRRYETGLISLDKFVPGDFLTRWVLS